MVSQLCTAASTGNTFALRTLTSGGFSVNTKDYDNRAALHVAAAKGSHDSVSFLIEKGQLLLTASPNID